VLRFPHLSLPKGCEGSTLSKLPSFFFLLCTAAQKFPAVRCMCTQGVDKDANLDPTEVHALSPGPGQSAEPLKHRQGNKCPHGCGGWVWVQALSWHSCEHFLDVDNQVCCKCTLMPGFTLVSH